MLHARPLVASGGDAQQDLLNLPEGIMTHFKRADRWIEAKCPICRCDGAVFDDPQPP